MTITTEETTRRAAGRPRSTRVDQAIQDATQEVLVEEGYGGMTIEGIAARAGVGKAAIYRRWATKAELVVDSLRTHEGLQVPLPDTGNVRADVEVMLCALQQAMAGDGGPVLAAFVAEKFRHPELRAEFDRVFVAERRRHLRHLVATAVGRGELPPDTDVELVAETGPALLCHRLFMHRSPPEDDLPKRIVSQLFGPR